MLYSPWKVATYVPSENCGLNDYPPSNYSFDNLLFMLLEEIFILFQRTAFTFQDTRASVPSKLNVQEHRHFPKSKFFTQNIIAVKTSSYYSD